jgi:hypothetical protein
VPAAIETNSATGLDDLERTAILQALTSVGGNQGLAAKSLGISRRTLSRKLSRYKQEGGQSPSPALGTLSRSEQQYYRARVNVAAEVSTSHGSFTCKVVNVSAGGISLDGIEHPFQLSAGFRLRCSLPGLSDTLEAEARLVWMESPGRIGGRFVDLSADLQAQLTRWLARKQAEEGWHVNTSPPVR